MILNKDCISKGYYKHSGIEGFVSVKQYMFIRKKGKKCLIQRFSNDSDFVVNALEYIVTELDAEGNVIKTDRIRSSGFTAAPGTVFAPPSGVVVSEECVDFKIRFISCVSGKYKYLVRNGIAVPIYDRLGYARKKRDNGFGYGEVSVKRDSSSAKRLSVIIAAVAVAVMLTVAVIGGIEEAVRISRVDYPDDYVSWQSN